MTVDPSGLNGKLVVGYQGWFAAPQDGSGLHWHHWFRNNTPSAANVSFELWPSVDEIPASALFDTQLTYADGSTARLYSAYRPEAVDVHFRWMQEYGIDGVALQRFLTEVGTPYREFRDQVTRNVRSSAGQHGRVFFIMYDIAGTKKTEVVGKIQSDWMHLVDELQITASDRYVQHRGRPLVAVYGFGLKVGDAAIQADPQHAMDVIDWFHHNAPPQYRATVMGGVPARWRSRTDDALSDPLWIDVYKRLDIISPWSVGRFGNTTELASFAQNMEGDMVEAASYGADYLPVVWPGFSWSNLDTSSGAPMGPFNAIPRRAGRFWWDQVKAFKQRGAGMLYGAMFDEVDEGTAIFKVAPSLAETPTNSPWLTLDADGTALPSDWYLHVAAETGRVLRGEAQLQAAGHRVTSSRRHEGSHDGISADGWSERDRKTHRCVAALARSEHIVACAFGRLWAVAEYPPSSCS